MAYRYAALLEKTTGRPVGLALEYDGGVLVDVPAEYGVPVDQEREFRVLHDDFTETVVAPGDDAYFGHVLSDLFWGFGVGEQGTLPHLSMSTYRSLRSHLLQGEQRKSGTYGEALPASSGVPRGLARAHYAIKFLTPQGGAVSYESVAEQYSEAEDESSLSRVADDRSLALVA